MDRMDQNGPLCQDPPERPKSFARNDLRGTDSVGDRRPLGHGAGNNSFPARRGACWCSRKALQEKRFRRFAERPPGAIIELEPSKRLKTTR